MSTTIKPECVNGNCSVCGKQSVPVRFYGGDPLCIECAWTWIYAVKVFNTTYVRIHPPVITMNNPSDPVDSFIANVFMGIYRNRDNTKLVTILEHLNLKLDSFNIQLYMSKVTDVLIGFKLHIFTKKDKFPDDPKEFHESAFLSFSDYQTQSQGSEEQPQE